MHFIESTDFLLRTISFDFIHPDKKMNISFRLVPMIHIGSQSFYDEVFMNLNACDEILYEGSYIKGVSIFGKLYEATANKLNLVSQREAFDYKKLSAKLIHTDLNEEESETGWKNLKWKEKFKLHILTPLQLFFYSKIISREMLVKAFMHSNKEIALAYGPIKDEEGTMDHLLTHLREEVIIKKILDYVNKKQEKKKLVGIMYGAAHMNPIARFLIDQLNYIPMNGQFMNVFDL